MELLGYVLLSFLWWQFLAATAISAGYHRYFSHRAYKAPVWFEYYTLLFGGLSASGSLLKWVWIHRAHHAHTDTQDDPHSPTHVGFWKVLGNRYPFRRIPRKFIKDLVQNKRVVFFHRNHKIVRLLTFGLGFIILPLPLFLVFIVSPAFYGYLGFGMLNAFCHNKGIPNNTWWVSIFTAGEGWHKNHHDNPTSIYNGTKWYHIDTGGYVSKMVERL